MEQEKDKGNNDNTSFKSEHLPSAYIGKCSPLCKNSVIRGIEGIEPLQTGVDRLNWEAESMGPM